MLWMVVANVLALAVIAMLVREINRIRADHNREMTRRDQERGQLLDRIMYLAGHPWTPPPLPDEPEQVEDPFEDDVMDTPLPLDGAIVYIDDLTPSARV